MHAHIHTYCSIAKFILFQDRLVLNTHIHTTQQSNVNLNFGWLYGQAHSATFLEVVCHCLFLGLRQWWPKVASVLKTGEKLLVQHLNHYTKLALTCHIYILQNDCFQDEQPLFLISKTLSINLKTLSITVKNNNMKTLNTTIIVPRILTCWWHDCSSQPQPRSTAHPHQQPWHERPLYLLVWPHNH